MRISRPTSATTTVSTTVKAARSMPTVEADAEATYAGTLSISRPVEPVGAVSMTFFDWFFGVAEADFIGALPRRLGEPEFRTAQDNAHCGERGERSISRRRRGEHHAAGRDECRTDAGCRWSRPSMEETASKNAPLLTQRSRVE